MRGVHAGVQADHVQRAERGQRRPRQAVDVLEAAHVDRHRDRLRAARVQRALRASERLPVAVGDHDAHALAAQPLGDRVADPARHPGDDRDLAVEVSHRLAPRRTAEQLEERPQLLACVGVDHPPAVLPDL